jgi:thiol:disulfide interchange protein DsbD
MSGAVTIGASWGGLGHSLTEDEGRRGAFFTGVLACVVASPCTAPFMGGALAFAIAQPAWAALAVFLALGLGLALPFLLIGFIPALADRLPRPGAWMETLKQFLAFPMYLTGVWLVWVLGHQVGMDGAGAALVGSVLLALALWWWEREQGNPGWVWRALLVAFFALALLPLAYISRLDPATAASASAQDQGYEPYSPERLAELQAEGRLVFVNMTADWCVTCKVNEKAVLARDAFKETLARHQGVYLKGDWTNEDPRITEFLQRFRAVGVPLYVVYPPQGEPVILPSILTPSMVQEALDQAMAK